MPRGDGLTDNQVRVVRFMKEFHRRNGYYATVRDVQAYMGWTSTETAYQVILALVDKGYVERRQVTRSTYVFAASRV